MPGLFGGHDPYSLRRQPAPQPQPQQSGGGGTRRIVGILGDALLGLAGQQGVYGPMMQQRRLLEQQQRFRQDEADRQRAAANEDWRAQYDYEMAHPKPVNNDTVADYNFILQNLGQDQASAYLRNRANPPLWRQGPDGQFYPVQNGAASAPPDTLPADFDFGGGAGGNASGNFRH